MDGGKVLQFSLHQNRVFRAMIRKLPWPWNCSSRDLSSSRNALIFGSILSSVILFFENLRRLKISELALILLVSSDGHI